WHQYLFFHVLNRYSATLEGNAGSFWFYAGIFFRQNMFFWSLLLALGCFILAARRAAAFLFVTVALLFMFLFFSAAGTKLPPYILVIYPLAATMIGTVFDGLVKKWSGSRWHSIL